MRIRNFRGLPLKDFPHKYYFYGSEDSLDIDVFIEVNEIPTNIETAIQYMKKLKNDFNLDWNMNMLVIENGIVVDNIPSKGSKYSLNNSLYHTYENHIQVYDNPIKELLVPNKLLNIYKCVRNILTQCTRVNKEYRDFIKPLKGIHPWETKIISFDKLDFTEIETFNQNYQTDIDTWKSIVFYLGQSLSLLDNIEIYSKKHLLEEHPYFEKFINREELTLLDKKILQAKKNEYLKRIRELNFINNKQEDGFYRILELDEFIIDMKKEIAL